MPNEKLDHISTAQPAGQVRQHPTVAQLAERVNVTNDASSTLAGWIRRIGNGISLSPLTDRARSTKAARGFRFHHKEFCMLIINAGSGPVANAAEELAAENMKQLVSDARLGALATITRASDRDYGDGRFAFDINLEGGNCEVQMPGRDLANVRYLGSGQNIWGFPRLYIDGSSWVWCFAVSQVRGAFNLGE